jgi:thiamine biosynthesis protein ThiS
MERGMTRAESIEVQVNGDPRTVPSGLDVHALLRHLGLEPELVVVELNGDILARGSYPNVAVSAGDVLELVHFVGGG